MAPAKKLVRALTDEVGGGFQITLETEDGQIVRVFATEDQLADLADEFDELLDSDDAEEGDINRTGAKSSCRRLLFGRAGGSLAAPLDTSIVP